jgi:membrane protease YdiL (CAAX protease family)
MTDWVNVVRIALAAFLAFVGPFIDLRLLKRLRATQDPSLRLYFYRFGSASLWAFGAVCFALMDWHGVLRLTPQVMENPGVLAGQMARIAIAVLTAGFFLVALLPGAACLFRERSRKAYTRALAKSSLSYLFPVGVQQRRWYGFLSIAAGICEEVMFRGFLLTVARGDLKMGLMVALLGTSVAFGFNHLYQGPKGMVTTAVTGLMLGLVAVLTGGLVGPMILHAAIDLQILLIYRPEAGDIEGGLASVPAAQS